MTLPDSMLGLTSLQIERCNALPSLPAGLGTSPGLATVFLGQCSNLTAIEGTWEQATSLTRIEIKACMKLGDVPQALRELSGHRISSKYKGPTGVQGS